VTDQAVVAHQQTNAMVTMATAIKTLDADLAARQEELAQRLAGRYPADYFRQAALTLMRRQPEVAMEVAATMQGRASFLQAVMQAADAGLPFVLGRYYLVPFRNNGVQEVQGIVGYQGLVDLITAPGTGVTFAEAAIVYSRDYFEWRRGSDGYLRHREWLAVPDMTEDERRPGRGKPIAVWARVMYRNGQDKWDVMGIDEVEDIRQRAPSAKAKRSPWLTDYDEMAKKTALRRLSKTQRIATGAMALLDDEEDFEYRRGLQAQPVGQTDQGRLRQSLQQRLGATEPPAEGQSGPDTPPEPEPPAEAVVVADTPLPRPQCGATVTDPGTGEVFTCTKPPGHRGDHTDGQHDWPR